MLVQRGSQCLQSTTSQATLKSTTRQNVGGSDVHMHRTRADTIVESLLGHFERWDGVYFAAIAKEGYKYEHFHAFFPLYPFLIRFLSQGLPQRLAQQPKPNTQTTHSTHDGQA